MKAHLLAVAILAAASAPAVRAQATLPGLKITGASQGPVQIACEDPPPADGSTPKCFALLPLLQPSAISSTPVAPRAAAASSALAASSPAVPPAGATPAPTPSAHALSAATGSQGDAAPTTEQKKSAFKLVSDFAQVDLSVPGSPAFAILGITPDKIQRPGTIRDFIGSVARGIGEDAKPVNGFALDLSPASVFFRKQVTGGRDYTSGDMPTNDLAFENYWKRLLARTTVSFANTSAESNGASRMAWGVRMGLIDFADPGLYWEKTAECLRKTTMPPIPKGRSLGPTPAGDDIELCNPANNPDKPLWAQPSLYFGFGRSWYSESGSLSGRSPDSTAFWLSGSIGMFAKRVKDDLDPMRTLLQLYMGRKINERTPDPDDDTQLVRKDSTEGVLRLKLGKDNWHGFLDWGRSRVRLGGVTTEHIRHIAFGAEVKVNLGEDTWVQLAGVNEKGFANGKDNNGVTVNFKFGMPFLELPGGTAGR